jgi:hypothetical protein
MEILNIEFADGEEVMYEAEDGNTAGPMKW